MAKMEYTQDMADQVCEHLMNGKSLRKIEAIAGMPNRLTILRWLRENPSFQTQYAHAREEQAEALAEEILDISDDGANDTYVDDEGVERTNHDVIARSRLRVDSRKWIASKLKPKKYGESTQVKHADADGNKLDIVSVVQALDGQSNGLPKIHE